jgi:predicted  nucleic acid-binding Zn-ribbon protein
MRDEADRLDSANKSLQERFSIAQNEASRLMKERNALAEEVAELKRKLESQERRGAVESKEADDGRATIRGLRHQLEEAREELERKVQDTAQFRQMKQLMQSQSSKITDLRCVCVLLCIKLSLF